MSTGVEPIVLLVVECSESLNWYQIFQGTELLDQSTGQRRPIQVEQGPWQDISLTSYSSHKCIVTMCPQRQPHPGTSQSSTRTFQPDFVLFRSVSRSIDKLDDRNLLYALKFANIPCVNSLEAMYMVLERPWVFSELSRVKQRLSARGIPFPLIEQTYYPTYKQMIMDPGFPCVIKVGPCHSGYGKILVRDRQQFDDVRSLVALHGDYCTAERFVDYDYEVRIQKIGRHYRVIKRQTSIWKGNTGNTGILSDEVLTDEFKAWIDECALIFGGLDICALDVLHERGKGWVVLELNDTAIGLVHKHAQEDMGYIKEVVILRMLQHLNFLVDTSDGKQGVLANVSSDEKQQQQQPKEQQVKEQQKEYLALDQHLKLANLVQENQSLREQLEKAQKKKKCVIM